MQGDWLTIYEHEAPRPNAVADTMKDFKTKIYISDRIDKIVPYSE
jgi:hypothetical protein